MLNKILNDSFDGWGICPFEYVAGRLIHCRVESRLPENAKSVIVAVFPYLLDEKCYDGINISRYAAVPDYHGVVMKRLENAALLLKNEFPENSFLPFADNSPIPEVSAACKAGLGVRGKNSLLITPDYGSFVFIGEIVTDLEIPSDNTEPKNCMECGKCLTACPTGAIGENGIDREICLSHITQKKGELSSGEKRLMKECGCLWGCDICQLACPLNRFAKSTGITEFINNANPRLNKDTDISGRAFEWRGKNVILRNIQTIYAENE